MSLGKRMGGPEDQESMTPDVTHREGGTRLTGPLSVPGGKTGASAPHTRAEARNEVRHEAGGAANQSACGHRVGLPGGIVHSQLSAPTVRAAGKAMACSCRGSGVRCPDINPLGRPHRNVSSLTKYPLAALCRLPLATNCSKLSARPSSA